MRYAGMVGILAAIAGGLWAMNRVRARGAILYYEEREPEVILKLGLGGARLPAGLEQMGAPRG